MRIGIANAQPEERVILDESKDLLVGSHRRLRQVPHRFEHDLPVSQAAECDRAQYVGMHAYLPVVDILCGLKAGDSYGAQARH